MDVLNTQITCTYGHIQCNTVQNKIQYKLQGNITVSTIVIADTQATSTFSEQMDALYALTLTLMYQNLDNKWVIVITHNKGTSNMQ